MRRKHKKEKKKLLYSRQGNEEIVLRLTGSCFKFSNKLPFITANKLIFHLKKLTI